MEAKEISYKVSIILFRFKINTFGTKPPKNGAPVCAFGHLLPFYPQPVSGKNLILVANESQENSLQGLRNFV